MLACVRRVVLGVCLSGVIHGPGAAQNGYALRFLRSIGSEQGPLSFGRIGVAAINDAGLLAVTDFTTCQIFLIPLNTDAGSVSRIGRCGDGPGEFRAILALTFHGDTLIAFDGQRREFVLVTTEGREVARHSLAAPSEFFAVTFLTALDDARLLIGRSVPPLTFGRTSEEAGSAFMVTLDRRTGQPAARHVPVPEVGQRNEVGALNHVANCRQSPRTHGYLVAFQEWRFEGTVLDPVSGREVARFRSPVRWDRHRQHPRGGGGVLPGAIATAAACGRDAFVVWQLAAGEPPNLMEGRAGRLEVRSWGGALLHRLDFGAADSLLHGRPLAGFGNLFVFRANELGEYPRLLVFELTGPGGRGRDE